MEPTSPRPLQEQDIDWRDAHERLRRYARSRMALRPDEVIEDVAAEAVVRLIRMVRQGPVLHYHGAIRTCGERAVQDFVRRWMRKESRQGGWSEGQVHSSSQAASLARAQDDPLERMAFVVRAVLGRRNAACLELFDAFTQLRDWGAVAEAAGRGHDAVRKQWQRCREVVEQVVRSDRTALLEWIYEHDLGAGS